MPYSDQASWDREVTRPLENLLDLYGGGKGGPLDHAAATESSSDDDLIDLAFRQVKDEFDRNMEPLQRWLNRVWTTVIVLSIAIVIAAIAAAFIQPDRAWVGAVLSTGGIAGLLGCMLNLAQWNRDQALLRFMPSEYYMAVRLCQTRKCREDKINEFLSESRNLRRRLIPDRQKNAAETGNLEANSPPAKTDKT